MRKAGELYFERWDIETAYDLIKSELEPENFSGKTTIADKTACFAGYAFVDLSPSNSRHIAAISAFE